MLTKPIPQPPIMTIVGLPGTGKTTLGALFPNPVFILAEEGTAAFESWDEDVVPQVMPVLPRADSKRNISTKQALLEQLRWLIKEEHDRKTLVIDSVTSLNTLLEHEVSDSYGVDNVADAAGGFHKGYNVVAEMHGEIRNACGLLSKKKDMTIIFLAHSSVKKMKNRPDADEYTVFSLDMHDKSIAQYTNLSDAVIYIRNEEFIKGSETDRKGNTTKFGKAIQTGNRVMVTSGDGHIGYVNAKNRYDLEPEMDLPKGENPLLDLIPYFTKGKAE